MSEITLKVGSPHLLRDHLQRAANYLAFGTDARHTLEDAIAQIEEQVPKIDPVEALVQEFTHEADSDAAEFWTTVQWRKHHDAFAASLSGVLTPQSDDGAAAPPAAGTAAESATATAAPSSANSWRKGYEQATKHTRERIYNRVARLKPQLITAVEKTAIDKALAEIEKDADDTVTGRGCPS